MPGGGGVGNNSATPGPNAGANIPSSDPVQARPPLNPASTAAAGKMNAKRVNYICRSITDDDDLLVDQL